MIFCCLFPFYWPTFRRLGQELVLALVLLFCTVLGKNTLNVTLDSNFFTCKIIFLVFFPPVPIYTQLPRPQRLVGCILLNHCCIKPICSSCPLLTTQLQLNLSEVDHYSLTMKLKIMSLCFLFVFLLELSLGQKFC